jgi:hypothetical protein
LRGEKSDRPSRSSRKRAIALQEAAEKERSPFKKQQKKSDRSSILLA